MSEMEIDEDFDRRFYADTAGEDALGVIVRGLIYIEHELIALVDENIPFPDAVKQMNLDYVQRIDLAIAIGLKPEFRKPLRTIGTLRNNFAHQLNARIGKQEANDFYGSLGENEKQVVQNSYNRVRSGSKKWPKKFKDADPLDQVRLVIVALRQGLRVGRMQAHEAKSQQDATV